MTIKKNRDIHMKYLQQFFTIFLAFIVIQLKAQTKSIAGIIIDTKGSAVAFASVTVKNTHTGTLSDADGKFIVKVKVGDVIVVASDGFIQKELQIQELSSSYNVILDRNEKETLSEVVVTTAFEMRKSIRTTPFSAQTITADNLNLIRQPNLNNALAGKMVGVQFRGQSSVALDREGTFRIRGGSTLNLLNGVEMAPLYVVDGNVMNALDITPDDIETINILKGANATALFGGRAANGAIVITSRKKNHTAGVGVELNTGFTLESVAILPRYQNKYAGGANANLTPYHWKLGDPIGWKALEGKGFPDYTDDSSWGPEMLGQEYVPWYAWVDGHSRSFKTAALVPQPNNIKQFWEKGQGYNTNLNFSKTGQGYAVRISYSNQGVKGLLPNSKSNRNTFKMSASWELNPHLTVSAITTFAQHKIYGNFNDGYANKSTGSFNSWFHRDLDMELERSLRNLITPVGTLASWNFSSNPNGFDASNPAAFYTGNFWNNYYAAFDHTSYLQSKEYSSGNLTLTYILNDNFNVRSTLRKAINSKKYENVYTSELAASAFQSGDLPSYSTGFFNLLEDNFDIVLGYNKRFGRFVVNTNLGFNNLTIRDYALENATSNGLNIPGLYSLPNSKAQPTIVSTRKNLATRSLFASGDIEYLKYISLTWAVRNDWYSTLPSGNNQLVSPSIGTSFIFSEFTKNKIHWLNFGKLFGSWGKKPRDIGVYDNNFSYSVNSNQWAGNFLMTTPDVLIASDLRGSLITTYEVGVDLRFLNSRIGLNVVYYNEDNNGEPVQVALSGVSGYTAQRINAAHIKKSGIEVLVNTVPIKNKNLQWQLNFNYSKLISNPVVNIASGLNKGDQIILTGGKYGESFARVYQEVGSNWGQLIGGGIARNNNGQLLIDPSNGNFVADATKHWGSVVPDLNGGVFSTFSYKQFTLGFNIDFQRGGKFFSLSEQWGNFSGVLGSTASINDNGKNIRDDISNGGGVKVVGVSSIDQVTPVEMYVPAQAYFQQFYFNKIAEPYIHGLSYVKVRELSFAYNFNLKKTGWVKYIQKAELSLFARNPLFIYKETQSFDPSEISGIHGEDGQFPGTRSIGVNLKLQF